MSLYSMTAKICYKKSNFHSKYNIRLESLGHMTTNKRDQFSFSSVKGDPLKLSKSPIVFNDQHHLQKQPNPFKNPNHFQTSQPNPINLTKKITPKDLHQKITHSVPCLYYNNASDHIMVYFHGNAEDICSIKNFTKYITKVFNVFFFSYSKNR